MAAGTWNNFTVLYGSYYGAPARGGDYNQDIVLVHEALHGVLGNQWHQAIADRLGLPYDASSNADENASQAIDDFSAGCSL